MRRRQCYTVLGSIRLGPGEEDLASLKKSFKDFIADRHIEGGVKGQSYSLSSGWLLKPAPCAPFRFCILKNRYVSDLDLGLLEISITSGFKGNSLDNFLFIGKRW